MVTQITSGCIFGVECRMVRVEIDVSNGLPMFEMVGRLSGEVKEAAKRVRVALKNEDITIPPQRITVNLAPADVPKEGTGFDLPIALGLMEALGLIPQSGCTDTFVAGELALDGKVSRINGVLPMVIEARKMGMKRCIIPYDNMNEANVVDGISIIGVKTLGEVMKMLQDPNGIERYSNCEKRDSRSSPGKESDAEGYGDFSEIRGQDTLKRAMTIAAAGFHNLLMIGPPGAGKTMAVKRLPGILPPMSREECLEVSRIYSAAGLLDNDHPLVDKRPFIAPHHTASFISLAGGGRNLTPGLISKADKGVLFLDEAVHFSSQALEVLRQPLEDKKIRIDRAAGSMDFPADFMLVAAINPCPCGNFPDPNLCRCTEDQVKKYLSRFSGPLLDRIDICVEMSRLKVSEIVGSDGGDAVEACNTSAQYTSERMREVVMRARAVQEKRFGKTGIDFNAQMKPTDLDRYISLGEKERKFMEKAYEKMHLSIRSYHKILRVARTIADIEGDEEVRAKHLQEALCYRSIEERYWKR